MSFAIGENVGPYRIVEQLGQGGMASVFKAYHAALDRYVALKVLHPAFLEDPNFLARFQREARVVARLEHPNIVPVYDFADHAGQPYLVMKYIEGETLKANLSRGPLAKSEGLRIVETVGGALSYAHSQRVLHRDIKPSNILLAPDGGIYLADFGLARIAQAGESTLSNDMLLGTPQYISPEQARGERNLDEGTDIYSFGVVLYEMVVGRVPFSADTPFSIIHDHIYTPLPMPRSVNPKVPEEVQRVLLKALAKDRGDRFGSVEEMVKAFRTTLGGGALGVMTELPAPLTSRPAGPQTRATPPAPSGSAVPRSPEPIPEGRTSKRSRWLWVAGGLALTCVCAFAFLGVAGQLEQGAAPPEDSTVAATDEGGTDGSQASGPLAEARRAVAANPEDPQARLALAAALMDEGLGRAAYLELLKAGELFLKAERYRQAAEAFGRAIEVSGGPAQAEPRVVEMLTQTLFLGAPSPEVASLIESGKESYPDWEVWPIVASRAMLLNGQIEQAQELVERSLAGNPEDPYALAVSAEIALSQGNTAEAQSAANRALSQPGVPAWLAEFLQELLHQTQPG
ncbi:MAG: protein kinase [Anaerolineales bacterium]